MHAMSYHRNPIPMRVFPYVKFRNASLPMLLLSSHLFIEIVIRHNALQLLNRVHSRVPVRAWVFRYAMQR